MEAPQTITDDVRQVLRSADGWLTADEIFERCELAERKQDVWSRLANMRRDREVIASKDPRRSVTRYRFVMSADDVDGAHTRKPSEDEQDTESGDEGDATVGVSEHGGSGASESTRRPTLDDIGSPDALPGTLRWVLHEQGRDCRLLQQDPGSVALRSDGGLVLQFNDQFGDLFLELSPAATEHLARFLDIVHDGIEQNLDEHGNPVPRAPLTGLPVEGEQ